MASLPSPPLNRRSTLPPPYDDSRIDQQFAHVLSDSEHLAAPSISDIYTVSQVSQPATRRGSASTSPYHDSTIVAHHNEHYSRPDPFAEALRHAEELRQLCTQCKDNDRKRVLHLGELVAGLTSLLRKARLLNALDTEEEQEQLQDIISNTEKAIAVQELATTASSQRRLIWNRAAALLVDIQNRLSEEHVSSSLRNAKQAIEEIREERRRREITQ